MANIYWVGVRESDLLGTGSFYKGSITLFGSGKNGNQCLFFGAKTRKDHNNASVEFDEFYEKSMIRVLNSDPTAKFMFYNQSAVQFLNSRLKSSVICTNDEHVLNILNHKMLCKLWLKKQVSLVPSIQMLGSEITYSSIHNYLGEDCGFVIQPDFSSGGYSTFVLNMENEKSVLRRIAPTSLYSITPYFEKAIPLNFHAVIYQNGFQLYPPSIQIVQLTREQLIYKGADFTAIQMLSDEVLESAKVYARVICERIRKIGYRGVCGIDFIVARNSVYFMEINPRFQASTVVLNHELQENGMISIHQACLDAFVGKGVPEGQSIKSVSHSLFTYMFNENDLRFTSHIWKKYFACYPERYVLSDGYQPDNVASIDSYLFRAIFPGNLISFHNNEMRLAEILTGYPVFNSLSPMQLKTMLINFGITIESDTLKNLSKNGNLREANFSALDITLPGGLIVNCPYNVRYSEYSPFEIKCNNGCLNLYYFEKLLTPIEICYESSINKKKTRSGVNYSSVAFLANDRLRINYNPVCYYKSNGQGCTFCNLPAKNQQYTFDDICEIAEDYLLHEEFRHILIGGGSGNPDSCFSNIIQLTNYLKSKTKKPLYLMSLPPRECDCVQALCQAGISEIAFNIEIFDRTIAAQYMPGKGSIPIERYLSALSEAVKHLGKTGNVRSMLIVGFDPKETLLRGIETLCEMGVQPMLSVFRPLEGTLLEHWMPPQTNELLEIFKQAADICKQHGLLLGPSCVFCQNNTLALPEAMYSL